MRWQNDRIGFDDRWVMLGGIIVFSFTIPVVFFGLRIGRPPFFNWPAYFTTLINAVTIWLGSRFIMIWARDRYPHFGQVRRRLWVQTSTILGFTLIANNVLGYLLKDYCDEAVKGRGYHITFADILIESNSAAIVCTLLVAAIYESIYFMSQLRKSIEVAETLKRESLEAQLDALKTQVNPHFLFNNLNTLSAIIPENPRQAVDFVQQMAKVYRHILEVRNERSIQLCDELDVLKAYAFLLKTRFGENLDIGIRVADEQLHQRIVPLALQILMENAIKHNIVSSARPLRIDVTTEAGCLIVSNNLQKKNQVRESTGLGLENIRNRYRLLGSRAVEVVEGPSCFTVSIPLLPCA